MRFTFPRRACKSSILPASASSSLRRDERGQERSMCPESSSASRHSDDGRCAACLPARRQVFEIRQRRAEASLIQHREPARGRPQHQAGAAIGALERRAFVARRLVKMLLVRRQVLEGVGRAQFVLGKWKIVEPGLAAVRDAATRTGSAPGRTPRRPRTVLVVLVVDASGDGRSRRYARRRRSPRSTPGRGGDRNPPPRRP